MSYSGAPIPLDYASLDAPRTGLASVRTPVWLTAIFICTIFAIATFSWHASQSWYKTESGDVAAMTERISEGQIERQVAFLSLLVYGLYSLIVPAARPTRFKITNTYLLLLFVVWASMSIAWSTDKVLTAKRLTTFVAVVLSVASIVRRFNILEIVQIAWIGSTLTMIIGIGNELRQIPTAPPAGLWRFAGTFHPNHAGINCAIVTLTTMYLIRNGWSKKLWGLFVLAFFLLIMSKSRTALMVGVVGCGVYWLLATRLTRSILAVMVLIWLGVGYMWLNELGQDFNPQNLIAMGRRDVKNADVTKLTGRTDIWEYAISEGNSDPNRKFIGWGYESFWTSSHAQGVSDKVKFKISEGHNVYIDWYLELGLVGVGMYVIIMLLSLLRWTKAALVFKSPSAAICAAVIVMAMTHGLTESGSGDALFPTFFYYCSLAGACVLRPDEEAWL